MRQGSSLTLLKSYIIHWATNSERQLEIDFVPDLRAITKGGRNLIPGYLIRLKLNGHYIALETLSKVVTAHLQESGLRYTHQHTLVALTAFIWNAFEGWEDKANPEDLETIWVPHLDRGSLCGVKDCTGRMYCWSLCRLHYDRLRRANAETNKAEQAKRNLDKANEALRLKREELAARDAEKAARIARGEKPKIPAGWPGADDDDDG